MNIGPGAYDEGLAQWTGARRAGMANFVSQGAALGGDDVSARDLNSYTNPQGREAASQALNGAYGSLNNQIGYALGEIAGDPTYAKTLAAVNVPGVGDIGNTAHIVQNNFEGNYDATTGNRIASAEEAMAGLMQAGPLGTRAPVTGDTEPLTASLTPSVTGDDTKKAPDLTIGQKAAKIAINARIGANPVAGPVLAAGNALSGLLGYGTIGEYLARNSSSAQVGSQAMSGADHSSATDGFASLQGGYGTGYGYGALDPSSASSAASSVVPVDPNAAARAVLAANATMAAPSGTASLSPATQAALTLPAYQTPTFYNPMQDPVVVNALRLARAAWTMCSRDVGI